MLHWSDISPLIAEPPIRILAATAVAGFFGGFVRGYSGFGFALAAVPILTLVLPPVTVIPAVLPIELAIGFVTMSTEHKYTSWRLCSWLAAGTTIGTPIGLTALASVSAEAMRIVIGVIAVIATVTLWRRPTLSGSSLGPISLAGVGVISGLLNGGSAMSGPPAIIALLSGNLQSRAARATLMAFVGFSAALALAIATAKGLLTPDVLIATMLMLPSAALGGAAGTLVFSRTPESSYRAASLGLLALVSALAIVSTTLNLLQPSRL